MEDDEDEEDKEGEQDIEDEDEEEQQQEVHQEEEEDESQDTEVTYRVTFPEMAKYNAAVAAAAAAAAADSDSSDSRKLRCRSSIQPGSRSPRAGTSPEGTDPALALALGVDGDVLSAFHVFYSPEAERLALEATEKGIPQQQLAAASSSADGPDTWPRWQRIRTKLLLLLLLLQQRSLRASRGYYNNLAPLTSRYDRSPLILEKWTLCASNSTANTNTSDGSADFDVNVHELCARALSGNFKKIFLPTVYGIIFTLGIVGNGLVVLVVGYQKTVKTTTDKYRLHLSIADLLFILTLPFWAETWHFGGCLCLLVHLIYTVSLYSTVLYSSVLILAFVSLDRYLAVIRATDSWATRKLLGSRVIYVGAWLPAAILTVPDLVFARVQDLQDVSSSGYLYVEDGVESTGSSAICQRIYPAESGLTLTAVFHFQHILVGFVLPGVVILMSSLLPPTEEEGESVVDSDTGTGTRDEVDTEASGHSRLPRASQERDEVNGWMSSMLISTVRSGLLHLIIATCDKFQPRKLLL
ncbi:hypothetical protein CRENBAI_010969 [Crenichthys baileyi]|uniref:G-protein coupled receptors family 1 profile domain-containing protein n=1 Tax=Crenichthys baileyi TaxID=28760 RepID=A0AAV9R0C7_9TELE